MVIQLTEQLLCLGDERSRKMAPSTSGWVLKGIEDEQRFEDQQVEIKIISWSKVWACLAIVIGPD